MSTRRYKIKKVYGLKGLPTGWFIYSRHILGRHIGSIESCLCGRARNLRRYRLKGFATRRGAIRAAKNLKRESDAVILPMVRKNENPK
jgi:hypothetical protein